MGFSLTLSALEGTHPRGVEKCFCVKINKEFNMLRFLAFTCVVAACAAQTIDPKDAKILKEQRFNSGDGRTGSAFATEDGKIFREETDANGNRIGQYSYIGEDGFRIIEGDHIRATGQEAAPFNPEIAAPQPAPAAPQPQAVAAPVIKDYDYEEVEE